MAWNGFMFNLAYDISIRALTFNHASTYIASVKYFQPYLNKLTTWPAHREVRGLDFSPDDAQFATSIDDYRTHMILRGELRGTNPYQPGMGGQMRRMAPKDGPPCVRLQRQSHQILRSLSWDLAHDSVCISYSVHWRKENTLT
jgi:hypothetical protein